MVANLGDGPALAETETVFFHPATGSKIHFKADGSIEITNAVATILLPVAGGVTITPGSLPVTVDGDLTVSGDIIAAGALTAGSATVTGTTALGATVTSGGVNISGTHVHSGVTTGGSNTGGPS